MNLWIPHVLASAAAHCPPGQIINFSTAGVILQPRQLLASAAARSCDYPDGPVAIGYGGARGGGKSYWLLAQMGLDDCQRFPGLKCLLLRKVGKSNFEHFEDLRQRLFRHVPHVFKVRKGEMIFPNGSRIIAKHFQHEKDLDDYLGLEYDVIGVEEATTLTARKYSDITTCCRSSKVGPDGQRWRPRIYSTTNPGGVGHAWYRAKFIIPHQKRDEQETRFIPALVQDNKYNNPDYQKVLERQTGWKKRAWLHGDWDIAAGQFFTNFRREAHVIEEFDDRAAQEWFAAFDYGFRHYTVVLLGCKDGDGNTFVVDEHAQREWLPERHARAIDEMLARHGVSSRPDPRKERIIAGISFGYEPLPYGRRALARFSAGLDVFSRQSDGTTIAHQYLKHGIRLTRANPERLNGWAEILGRLGDPDAGVPPKLFIHKRCKLLLNCLPSLQHDPNHPEDVLKVDVDEDGLGGDDAADALRYLLATKPRELIVTKLRGL